MHDPEKLADELVADVARRIGELRAFAGLSQADVAERIGTNVSNYQRIEHGLQNVTLRTLARIAAAIGVNPQLFFSSPQSPRPSRGRPRSFDAARERVIVFPLSDTPLLVNTPEPRARREPSKYPTKKGRAKATKR